MKYLNFKQKLLGAVALLALVSTTESFAQGTTQNLNVTAEVPSVCIIDVPTSAIVLAFDLSGLATAGGPFDSSVLIAWRCSVNTPLTVEISDGTSSNALARTMLTGGGDPLAYNLYTDIARSTIWDEGSGAAGTGVVTDSGRGMNVPWTSEVFGRVTLLAAQSALPGIYSDDVTVTLVF